ncbi:hypothetical protein CBP51_09240 [Cellvibrio mixtus]|uniref:Uncharacterized protein n=1 Tax=Cellvibrio mixtus TaxID=39650 RepID=A0A266QBB7_9GAMM|nr:hypothetical protein [Cellvibrio mixtus]OZY87152.1 hypothetical protein CBP51_09240 [Cellvibrio mixtus]
MMPELKEKLLLRLFSSIEYMEEFTNHYIVGLQTAEDAFSIFEKKCSLDVNLANRYAIELRQWQERVIPNFKWMKENALLSLDKAKMGDFDYMDGATGNLRGLSKDMDGIGDNWWLEVDELIRRKYADNMNKAKQMGGNIYNTLSDFWDPGEVLIENIIGPVDESLLLKYLLPGEHP